MLKTSLPSIVVRMESSLIGIRMETASLVRMESLIVVLESVVRSDIGIRLESSLVWMEASGLSLVEVALLDTGSGSRLPATRESATGLTASTGGSTGFDRTGC